MFALFLVLAASPLVPLPPQPEGQAWPGADWPTGTLAADVDAAALNALVDAAVKGPDPQVGQTRAVLAIHRGQLVLEKYAPGFDASTRQVSWSVAKSITQALVGVATLQGKLNPDQPMGSVHWKGDDARAQITWRNWLQMNDGQNYHELDPRGIALSDSARKLFGPGRLDVAKYCSELPLTQAVGKHWNYNSCGIVLAADALTRLVVPTAQGPAERRAAMRQWMVESFFGPLGMTSATPQFDAQGLYYGSALIYLTARDFARLGYLYLRDGKWGDRRIVPEGWVDFARGGGNEDDADAYGAGWWVTSEKQRAELPADCFRAQGFEGQLVMVVPSKDLVLVRLGHFGDAGQNWDALATWIGKAISTFPDRK